MTAGGFPTGQLDYQCRTVADDGTVVHSYVISGDEARAAYPRRRQLGAGAPAPFTYTYASVQGTTTITRVTDEDGERVTPCDRCGQQPARAGDFLCQGCTDYNASRVVI